MRCAIDIGLEFGLPMPICFETYDLMHALLEFQLAWDWNLPSFVGS